MTGQPLTAACSWTCRSRWLCLQILSPCLCSKGSTDVRDSGLCSTWQLQLPRRRAARQQAFPRLVLKRDRLGPTWLFDLQASRLQRQPAGLDLMCWLTATLLPPEWQRSEHACGRQAKTPSRVAVAEEAESGSKPPAEAIDECSQIYDASPHTHLTAPTNLRVLLCGGSCISIHNAYIHEEKIITLAGRYAEGI